MRPLTEIEACFQGVVPSYMATSSADGEPNVTAVSIVHLLSPTRIGVSCQFMNKSLRNLRETRRAQLLVLHPETVAEYVLDAEFAGQRVGPHPEQPFHQRTRQHSRSIREVALRFPPIYVEIRHRTHIPRRDAHVHRGEQRTLGDLPRLLRSAGEPEAERRVHGFAHHHVVD